jgi:sulfur carrier protein ThiS
MTMRVFVNATPVDVPQGTDVRGALRALDPALEDGVAAGSAYVTDARGIPVPLDTVLAAGSILRVVVSARRATGGADADA